MDTNCFSSNDDEFTERSLVSLVRDITLFYVKHHYEKYLKEKEVKIIPSTELRELVNRLYEEKKIPLTKYIRKTLKENQGQKYSSMATEQIILEMFQDPEYSKNRVIMEIENYQQNLKIE
jgi:hypothetical protein